jgi:hypothetical protein
MAAGQRGLDRFVTWRKRPACGLPGHERDARATPENLPFCGRTATLAASRAFARLLIVLAYASIEFSIRCKRMG